MARFYQDFYLHEANGKKTVIAYGSYLSLAEGRSQSKAYWGQKAQKGLSGHKVCSYWKKSPALGQPAYTVECFDGKGFSQQVETTVKATVTCPPGYVFVNGKCVLKSPVPSQCPPGTTPVNGLCVPTPKTGPGGRVLRKPGIIAGPFDSLSETMEDLGGGVRRREHPHQPLKSHSHRLNGLPFALGEPVSTVAKYKAILVAWGGTSGVSKPVPNYGTVADDLSPTWNCMRDGRMLSAFSKWWNSKGNKISKGTFPFSGACKGILVAELDAPHMAALDAFAAGATNVVVPGGGWACPAGQLWNPLTGKCELIPIIPISWQTPGGDQPPGGGLPPPPVPVTPPGGGVPPITPGVQDCDGKNPCPAGQVCVGGKCQPALPPPPSAKPSTEEAKSSSNVGWWVAGGVAAVGLLALVFGGKSSALLMNPYARPGERVRHLQYREALAAFKRRYAGPKNDKPRMGEAWSRYIDELAREGLITEAQASRWDNPFYR